MVELGGEHPSRKKEFGKDYIGFKILIYNKIFLKDTYGIYFKLLKS